jgi:hypothetical protein
MFVSRLNNTTFGKPDMVDSEGRQYKKTTYENVYDIRLTRSSKQKIPDKRDLIKMKTGEEFIVSVCALNPKEVLGGLVGPDGKLLGSRNCGRIEMKMIKDKDRKQITEKERKKKQEITPQKQPQPQPQPQQVKVPIKEKEREKELELEF